MVSRKDRRRIALRRKAWALVRHLDAGAEGVRHEWAMTDALDATLRVLQRFGRDAEAREAGINRYCEAVRYYR